MTIFSKTLTTAGLFLAMAAPTLAQGLNTPGLPSDLLQLQAGAESTEALPGWNTCSVALTGVGSDDLYAYMACPGEMTQWYKFREAQEDAMLATTLSAVSLGKSVTTLIGPKPDGASHYEVLAIYVVD